MKYGERLKTARQHARLTQAGLAEAAGVGGQRNVSKLESGDAEGSEFTAQYARACGVDPYWLATGEGSMLFIQYPSDQRIAKALTLLQEMPDYAIDKALGDIDSLAKFIEKTGTDKNG